MAGDELQNDAPHSIKGGKIQQTKSAAQLRVSQQSGGVQTLAIPTLSNMNFSAF